MIAPVSRRIGSYEIISKLGRGGMADVYLAQHDSGQRVALKLIEHSPDSDTRDAIEAERRGAGLQAQLADIDPRVVRVYDSSDADGFFYVAMEYIEGQDLAELMKHGPLAVGFACDAALAVAETLEHAHNLEASVAGKGFRGIVHGDIKPKNIRIDTRGEVRVLDFGIAKALSLSRRLTRNEFGSVPYASPERLDSGDVNVMSDLWSLAVMLYEMVTGLQPYQAENTERLERMIRSRIPPPPAPDPCPPVLRAILQRALAIDPAVRYPSAHDFAAQIAEFRGIMLPLPKFEGASDATRRTIRTEGGASEETRRTAGPAEDQGETRRTLRTEPADARPVSGLAAPVVVAKPKRSVFGTAMRVVGSLAIGCVIYGAWSGFSWMRLHDRGKALEREIKSEQLTDPDQIWNKWSEIAKDDPGSWALWGARSEVEHKLQDGASAIIARYHNNTQVVYEKDWETAQTELAHVLAVDPDNDLARGELRLCDGQIARINGIHNKSVPQLNLAVEKFNEAARLLPKSPDPYLGLAYVYVYGLSDIDKAYAALQDAQKRGYQLGNRENSQLADGYARRADRLFRDASNVRGLPQEKDQIQRAASDYQKAIDIYQSIVPYGNSSAQIGKLQHSLDVANGRLHSMDTNSGGGNTGASNGGQGSPGLAGTLLRRVLEVAGEKLAKDLSGNPTSSSENDSGAAVYSVGNGVTQPIPTYQPAPEYTDQAKRFRVQGEVVLDVEVDPSGRVVHPRVVQGLGYGLDEKAMQAIANWRFRPGTLNGNPVTVRQQVHVTFRLS